MRKLLAILITLALCAAPAAAMARGSSGGGGSRSSGGGGGSKSSGGSTKSSGSSGGGSKSYSSPKSYSTSKKSLVQPSSGKVKQPAPLPRLLPPVPPARSTGAPFRAPAGRNYGSDRNYILTHREYANPYYGSYYGSYNSIYNYLWISALLDNDSHNNPAPPEADEGEIAQIFPSELKLVAAAMEE